MRNGKENVSGKATLECVKLTCVTTQKRPDVETTCFSKLLTGRSTENQPDLSVYQWRERERQRYDTRIRKNPQFAKLEQERKEWLRLEARRKLSRILSEQPKEKWMEGAVELFGRDNWDAQSALLNVRSQFENGNQDAQFKLFETVYDTHIK